MANEQNLQPIRSESEAREKGKKGGQKSGETRRKKRDLKNRLKDALNCMVEGDTAKKIAMSIGVKPEEATNYDVIVARLMLQAFKGDTKAMQMIFDYMGETPAEKRAESEEKRRAELFKMQVEQINDLDRDNDAVLQYINGMKNNMKDDTSRTEQETN